jgi:hypothetical protein
MLALSSLACSRQGGPRPYDLHCVQITKSADLRNNCAKQKDFWHNRLQCKSYQRCRSLAAAPLCPFTFAQSRKRAAVKWNGGLGVFTLGARFVCTKVTGTLASLLWQTTPTLGVHG